MTVFGIDPGSRSGAVGWTGPQGAGVSDLPLIDGFVDPHALSALLSGQSDAQTVFVENVSALPKQGVASTFKFGRAFGTILATVQLSGLRLELVTPRTWKKHHRLGRDKESARALAIRRFPRLASDLARKKDADRAEALLIADFGRAMLG